MIKDPYVYEGTDVLINKLNIRDKDCFDKRKTNSKLISASFL